MLIPAADAVQQGATTADPKDADRFDYNKDPISWFYQVRLLIQLCQQVQTCHKPTPAQPAACCVCQCCSWLFERGCMFVLFLWLQNQIKSEEQFQAKKSELRTAAKERLENIFENKGKVSGGLVG